MITIYQGDVIIIYLLSDFSSWHRSCESPSDMLGRAWSVIHNSSLSTTPEFMPTSPAGWGLLIGDTSMKSMYETHHCPISLLARGSEGRIDKIIKGIAMGPLCKP